MAVDDAPPLVVIGMEGIWGTAIMVGVCAAAAALPGRDMGSVENTWDSLRMVKNSHAIQVPLSKLPRAVGSSEMVRQLRLCGDASHCVLGWFGSSTCVGWKTWIGSSRSESRCTGHPLERASGTSQISLKR